MKVFVITVTENDGNYASLNEVIVRETREAAKAEFDRLVTEQDEKNLYEQKIEHDNGSVSYVTENDSECETLAIELWEKDTQK